MISGQLFRALRLEHFAPPPQIPQISILGLDPGCLAAEQGSQALSLLCTAPARCLAARSRRFWLHYVMSEVTLAAFCLLIRDSSKRGGVGKGKADGGSGQGKYAGDKQVNGDLCTDS